MASDTRGRRVCSVREETSEGEHNVAQTNEDSGVQATVPREVTLEPDGTPEFGLCLLVVALFFLAGICFTGDIEWLSRLIKWVTF